MEKRPINPWQWQDGRSYVQAVEVKQVIGTLYCSGQAAVDADGRSSTADMRTQLAQAIDNLERVIREADYECRNIVRLTVYTTSTCCKPGSPGIQFNRPLRYWKSTDCSKHYR